MGIGAGREAGCIKPRNYIHCTPQDKIYHIDCGGQVERKDISYSDFLQNFVWDCNQCKRRWDDKTMRNFSDQDLRDRFYLLPEPDSTIYVIVEDTDGFKTFTRTVTWAEAKAKGLKRVPDMTK
jgi:hypothetical protein